MYGAWCIFFVVILLSCVLGMATVLVMVAKGRQRGWGKGTRKSDDWEERHKNVFMVVLGSGGHTAEMMQVLRSMDWKEKGSVVRCYVVAETDRLSGDKARAFEQDLSSDSTGMGTFVIECVSRSREVGQRYITSVWTTILALWSACGIVMRHSPKVLLVNGPGTCLPVVVWCRLASMIGVISGGCNVFYVESIARVDHLSLTGRLVYHLGLANGGFYVQWKELHEKLGKSVYAGRVY